MFVLILDSVIVFTGIILFLVALLLLAEWKLVRTGNVQIVINDNEEKPLIVPIGKTLLNTLTDNSILVPSACGGGGTCAMCKVRVVDGGGDLLPTELGHIGPELRKRGVRLSCQLKVKSDMRIVLPPEVFSTKMYQLKVRSNRNVATYIKELILEMPENQRFSFKAGGYVQIEIPAYPPIHFADFEIDPEYRDEWEHFDLFGLSVRNEEALIRAFSMANHPAEDDIVMLNVRIATPPNGSSLPPGLASSYIFNLKPNDPVVVSGPYGEFFVRESEREMVFVGGGAGMAPMRSHIFDQLLLRKTKRKMSFWYGARSKREMFYDQDFRKLADENTNFSYHVGLSEPLAEDQWTASIGYIHKVVAEEYLNKHLEPEEIEYYLCGPPQMIAACRTMLDQLGVRPEMILYDEF